MSATGHAQWHGVAPRDAATVVEELRRLAARLRRLDAWRTTSDPAMLAEAEAFACAADFLESAKGGATS